MVAKPTDIALLLAFLIVISGANAYARDMYRYTNDQGNTVVDYKVPPEFAARGYEVLNEKGAVIEVVPRALRLCHNLALRSDPKTRNLTPGATRSATTRICVGVSVRSLWWYRIKSLKILSSIFTLVRNF